MNETPKEVKIANSSSFDNSSDTNSKSYPLSTDDTFSNRKIESLSVSVSQSSTPPVETYWMKHIGKTIALVSDKEGNPYFTIGPDWQMFVCFSSIITIIMILFFFLCWDLYTKPFQIIGYVVYSLYLFSYLYTFLINPGIPKNEIGKYTGEPKEDYRYCELCKYYVKKRALASHCPDCCVCVEGYDHHCPWVGKCVGKNNMTSFKIFLFSTLAIVGYIACAVVNAAAAKQKPT